MATARLTHGQILEKMEAIGLTVNHELITFKAFKALAHVGKYGRGKNIQRVFYFYTHPKENMFSFESAWRGTQASELKECYQDYKTLLEAKDGDMGSREIRWGNSGIPLSPNPIYVTPEYIS